MKNIYFQFGHASWWKYFIELATCLKNESKGISVYGMTTGVEAFWGLKKTPHITEAVEDVYIKIRRRKYEPKLLQDEILRIEALYGNIWTYAYADRQLVSYHHNERYSERDLTTDEVLSVVVGFFKYFEQFFDHYSIDTVFTYATASAPFLIAAEVIKSKGGNYYQIGSFRYPDFTTLFSGPDVTTCALVGEPTEEDYVWANNYYEKLNQQLAKPAWTEIVTLVKNAKKKRNFLSIKRVENSYKTAFPGFDVDDPGHLTPPIKTRLKRKLNSYLNRILGLMNTRLFCDFPEDWPFAFFPLHVEPEASTMIMGQDFLNQVALIELIARSLPYGLRLCVKEHPWMVGKRSPFYYNRLVKIPNVILLQHSINSEEIIKQSTLIVTNTGTAGLEGFILGKPVIVFGTTHFNSLHGVFYFDNPVSTLYSFIKNCLDCYVPNQRKIVEYMAYAKHNSINLPSSFVYKQDMDETVIANQLMRLIHKLKISKPGC